MSQISNKFLKQMATLTIKGNNTGGTANPSDLTVPQVVTMLNSANQQLSNLSSTAVNVSILPGTNNTLNLGALNFPWLTGYISNLNDDTNVISASPNGRTLYDFVAGPSINWNSRTIFNAAGSGMMNWTTSLQLSDTAGFLQFVVQPGAAQVRNSLQFYGATSTNNVTISANTSTATYSLTLPTAQGTANQALTQSGTVGTLAWASVLTNPMTTLGDIIYENATPAPARLTGSTSTTLAVLTQTGTGSASAAPVWTTSTGSGSVVLATSPTLSSPVVGTQAQFSGNTIAASTAYVDTAVANAVAGINPAVAVQAATTSAGNTSGLTYNNGVSGVGATFTGTANTAIVIDGYTFTALGQRLLVKNDTQSANPGAYNGVYYVTQVQTALLSPILTRALDYDTPSDINNTGAIPVVSGTVNGTTSWVQTAQIVTVGTTPLVFVQFSLNPSTVLINPMTTGGDIIYGGSSGTPTRLANGTAGQVLTSSGGTAAPAWSNPINGDNLLNNSAFDYWQAGTSVTVTASGGGSPTSVYGYQADQWYVQNILGGGTTEAVLTYAQTTGSLNGSLFGASIKVTTAPTGTNPGGGGWYFVQPLSNLASQALYNQTASFSINVKALGNVNSVGIDFVYATSEAKPASGIGTPVTATVNSSGFTLITINGQALGTSQTTAGIIGVRVYVNNISTGNFYDLNNGFIVEQAMLNLGPVAAPFQRQYNDPVQELMACKYFYEIIGGNASSEILCQGFAQASTAAYGFLPFQTKRVVPTVSSSASNSHIFQNGTSNYTATAVGFGSTGLDRVNCALTISGATVNSGGIIVSNGTGFVRVDARI